ncbi:hypothetical protein QNH88_24745, partial [Klebsiella pneumoniae]|uniref:hypothetical protein n=1 Tax=Klebsiella pneumoniae TaxID=573 RepID=UPI00255341EB
MQFKRAVSLAVAVSIVTNTLSWAYYVTLINIVMAPKVYAANEIYEQLENNFDLSNPAANRTSTVTTAVSYSPLTLPTILCLSLTHVSTLLTRPLSC